MRNASQVGFFVGALAALFLFLVQPHAAHAQVPTKIGYQGYLTSSAGTPVNTTVQMVFRLYTAASGGAPLWSETHAAVVVANGNFSAVLGSSVPLGEGFLSGDRWLSVQVGVDAEMSPRLALSSGPYSIRSQRAATADSATNATNLGGQPASSFASASHNHDGQYAALGHDHDSQYAALGHTHSGADISGTLGSNVTVSGATIAGTTLTQLDNRYGTVAAVQAPQANSITTVDSTLDYGRYPSITIGTDGLPIAVYYLGSVVKCGNSACSSGNAINPASGGSYLSIAIGADGLPVYSHYEGGLKVTKCGNQACASGNATSTLEPTSFVGLHTSLAIGADGLPVIAYWDNPNTRLKVAKCGDAACSSGNTITVVDTGSGNVGAHSAIAIGADGLPVISYRDDINLDLKVLKCGNAACTSGNTITTVDSTGDVGMHTAIAIGANGNPFISYYDTTNSRLKAVMCGNAACSGGLPVFATVDNASGTGTFSSIAIGADNLPVISYYDSANGDLKVAKCGNEACSSGNTITMVDSVGDVGQYTSITIGADGLPVIAYYDVTNGALKVAKCANPFCAPYFRRR